MGAKRLVGRNDKWGRNDQGETIRGKRFGGETTRGGNGLEAKRPRFCYNIMLLFLLRSTVDKFNYEQDFSIVHKPVIISQYAIV